MKSSIRLIVLLLGCFCYYIPAIAQNNINLPGQSLSISAGSTKAGTGDVTGIQIGVEYEKFFRKRLSWSADLVTTIHNQEDPIFYIDEVGQKHDMSLRFTTAGIQIGGKVSYYFVRSSQWAAGLRVGTFIRRQSSSLPDISTTIYPILTGQPFPLTAFENNTPQTTYSVGGTLNFFANYTIKQKVYIGAGTGLQLDTNGDTFFPQLLFTVGRRF